MRIRQQLVRLWKRPSKDGTFFTYYIRYVDLEGKYHCQSLRHGDRRRAEKQQAKKEKELRMGYCNPGSVRLSDFMEDSLERTGSTITPDTWEWHIKDHEERTVPISKNAAKLLIGLQEKCPPGYPYVFIPHSRYDYIQKERRAKGDWTYSDSRLDVYNNFYRQFNSIFKRAKIKKGKFHDCRSTALSNWLAQGLSEYEVMRLAGHSSFETTHRFYLAIKNDYLDKARKANVGLGLKLVEWE